MSGDHPLPTKTVSPVKWHEKPWDVWVAEIGYRSPRREEEKPARRRGGLSRLRHDAMPLHGLLPQSDTLDAAVCHLCGAVVKVSAAYRHLRDAHAPAEPLLPPPPAPAPPPRPKSQPARSRHKKEPPPAPPPDVAPAASALPALMPALPVPPVPPEPEQLAARTTVASPALARPPPPDLQYLEEAGAAAVLAGELQVSVDTGDLPVVSIQDPEDLPLGENLTDDIFAIMNSEGIQSADDITNAADWKNIIRDIGNMQEINFPSVGDPAGGLDPFAPAEPSMAAYGIDAEALRFAPDASPAALDASAPPAQTPKPATPSTKASRKTSKTKFNLREYDPNKHCGVATGEAPKPCTRSLTCKAHALSLRRAVEGRSKPFDTLLAEHRAAREAAHASAPPALAPELAALADAAAVDDMYASLLGGAALAEDAVLPDTSGIAALLAQPDEEAAPEGDGACWYAAVPRPLALCTFNASHAGGAVALGKRYATVRSNVKSSLARPCKAAAAGAGAGAAGARGGAARRPELRRLVVRCGRGRGLGELLVAEARLNGHAPHRARLKPKRSGLDLAFSLDPLLADEKC